MTHGVLKTTYPLGSAPNGYEAIAAFFRQQRIPKTQHGEYDCVLEHGQLWVIHPKSGTQWSVVNVEDTPSVDGFDFDLVSEDNDQ